VLRIQTTRPALVHWSMDNWRTTRDTTAREIGSLRIWIADLETSALPVEGGVDFTLYYPEEQRWEQRNYRVAVG